MSDLPDPRDVAKGKWKFVLTELGVSAEHLTGRNCPCPMCGGKDRFRFTNHDGDGLWVCNQCGAGNGSQLLERSLGWDFAKVASEVRRVCKVEVPMDDNKPPLSAERRKEMLNGLWLSSVPMKRGDMVDAYLQSRKIVLDEPFPADLRYCRECPVTDVVGAKTLPAMVALVRDKDGVPNTLHRTYLRYQGKANIDRPRRLMPGATPHCGQAVRLFALPDDGVMGVAEGIETALAAAALFKMPVWSCLSADWLGGWEPPPGIHTVHVFGDNDENFTGQHKMYALANRLMVRKSRIVAHPLEPNEVGRDWADVWANVAGERAEEAAKEILKSARGAA